MRGRQRVGEAEVRDVAAHAPVGARALAGLERAHGLALAQRAHLVVDHAEDAEQVPAPVVVGVGLGLHLAAGVGDEDRAARLPGGLEAEVVVDAAVGEHRALAVLAVAEVVAVLVDPGLVAQVELEGGEDGREGRGGRDRVGERDPRPVDAADAPVGHVRLGEAEQRARLHARRVDDEARVVGEVLERRVAEQVLAVGLGHALGDRVGGQRAHDHRRLVDGPAGQRPHRRDEGGLEPVGRDPRPGEGERAGGDRAAGHARDAVEALQPAGVVQPPDHPDVEEHRPVSAS